MGKSLSDTCDNFRKDETGPRYADTSQRKARFMKIIALPRRQIIFSVKIALMILRKKCNFYSKNNFKILTCWLRQHFSFLSRNPQNCVVPRGRLGSQTLCPYRVLPWNPRPGDRPGYFINVFSPILARHSILGSYILHRYSLSLSFFVI